MNEQIAKIEIDKSDKKGPVIRNNGIKRRKYLKKL
tara:strand:- start:218 stop:322 length:105 start_codon:yes stop_codon:yes gene_type:complete